MSKTGAVYSDGQVFSNDDVRPDAVKEIKLSIQHNVLQKALAHVQSVVERRNTIPILSNVKLEAYNNTLALTTTDMDIAVTETIPADIMVPGSITVSAHTLYDIVRKLPDGAGILLEENVETRGRLRISSGSCNFSLASLPATDFPVMDKGNLSHTFSLAAAELIALIDKTKFAASTEETRYYLNGIYLHAREGDGEGVLRTVATDGHRLARCEVNLPAGAAGMPGVIIPRKTVAELRRLLDGIEEEVEIALSETKICFSCDHLVLLSKLIDGTFPEYENVIPKNNKNLMEVKTSALIKAVDRMSVIASEKSRAIKFSVQENTLTLAATNEDSGTAAETIEVQYNNEPVTVNYNSRYLLEMLAGIEGETVHFLFAESGSPALVKDMADKGVLYVIMPMRL